MKNCFININGEEINEKYPSHNCSSNAKFYFIG